MALDGIIEMRKILDRLETAIPGPLVTEWLNNIADPSFGLVDDLVNTFLTSVQDNDVSKHTVRILRQLNTHIKAKVLPQILENKVFPEAMYKYITGTKPEEVCHDAFLLFTAIYGNENFKDLKDVPSFMRALFDALEYIQEENAYTAVVRILISSSKESEELFLELCSTHKNARYFGELLLQLLNKSEGGETIKCLECLKLILESTETQGFFYTNDLKLLCDIVIQNLENLSDFLLKARYFEVLKDIVKSNGFLPLNHRTEEIKAISEIYANSDVSEMRSYAEIILDTIKSITQSTA
ncbi:unnamed protein product [Blepharisma stoltei]|uniref:SPIN90/Ldb17 leucine-rich domain-containing protein n=1 Tax=Blepharisma stoltei TaxID=1481888 RepID=A0AAU9K5F7_9CILI|nr:unnamed protein product [Blepharisma stoltei]